MDEIQNTTVEMDSAAVEDDEDLFDSASWEETSNVPDEDNNNEADESVEEESDETEENAPSESENTDPSDSKGEQDQPDFMKIKFNKEEISLSHDQAVELAQKGMNYDRIYESYQASAPIINEINRLAQLNGMNAEEFMLNLSQVQSQFELNAEMDALREQYPDSDEALLEELARTHLNNRSAQAAQQQQQHQNARKMEINRQMDIFEKRYPNVDPAKLDMDVYRLMKDGYTLLEAYETVMADKRAAQEKANASREKVSKQNEENKRRSLGNISSNGARDSGLDEFTKELFSD